MICEWREEAVSVPPSDQYHEPMTHLEPIERSSISSLTCGTAVLSTTTISAMPLSPPTSPSTHSHINRLSTDMRIRPLLPIKYDRISRLRRDRLRRSEGFVFLGVGTFVDDDTFGCPAARTIGVRKLSSMIVLRRSRVSQDLHDPSNQPTHSRQGPFPSFFLVNESNLSSFE